MSTASLKRKSPDHGDDDAPAPSSSSSPKWVAIHARKGGVGKTNATIQLARFLAGTSKVLIIDSDAQCNLTNCLLPVPKDGKIMDRDFVAEFKDYVVPKSMKLGMTQVHKRKENPKPHEIPYEYVQVKQTPTLCYHEYWVKGVDNWTDTRYDTHGAVQCPDNKNIFVVPGSHKSTTIDARISILRALTKTMPGIVSQLIGFVENFEHLAQTLGCKYILVDLPPTIGGFGCRVLTLADAVISISTSEEPRNGAFSLESILKMPQDFDTFMNGSTEDYCSEEGALNFLCSIPGVLNYDNATLKYPGLRVHPSKIINWVGHIQNMVVVGDKGKDKKTPDGDAATMSLKEYDAAVSDAVKSHHKTAESVSRFKTIYIRKGATNSEWQEQLKTLDEVVR